MVPWPQPTLLVVILILHEHHNRLNIRKQFFACHVVNVWNSLPAYCINFSPPTSFRISLLKVDLASFNY